MKALLLPALLAISLLASTGRAAAVGPTAIPAKATGTPDALAPAVPAHAPVATEVARNYMTSLAALVAKIDQGRAQDTHEDRRLRALRSGIYPQLGWIRVRADEQMVALTSGRFRTGVWAGVLEPGHPALETWAPTLQSSQRGDMAWIMVRPDAITSRWAGIFLFHELSHAFDTRHALDHPGAAAAACESEFEAYTVEALALERLTDGRFGDALDAALSAAGFGNAQEIHDELDGDQMRLGQAIALLDTTLGEPAPLSVSEREMRDGFYLVALADRAGLNAGLDRRRRCEAIDGVLRHGRKD